MANLSPFLQAAASAFRTTGVPEAVAVAAGIEAHVKGPFPAAKCGAPAALAHLGEGLRAGQAHPAVAALEPIVPDLPWVAGRIDCYCYATLIGPGRLIPDDAIYFGVYLQAPDTFYPSHLHVPEELYYGLSGTADWQMGEPRSAPFAAKRPGTLIHHRPSVPHAMRTAGEPLLAMWAWFGDLAGDTYRFVD